MILKRGATQSESKEYKKKACVCMLIVVVVLVSAFCGVWFGYMVEPNPDTIKFVVPETIQLNYGERLKSEDWHVEFFNNVIDKNQLQTSKEFQISEFDPEKIGTQTIVLTFAGQTYEIQVTILPQQLDAPTASLSGNKIVWNAVEKAQKYFVCIATEDGPVEAVYETSVQEFDLSSIAESGELNVCVVAASSDARYADSERSSAISFIKANGVDGVVYDGQKLVWNAVENAISYTLIVNNQTTSNQLRL